MAAVATDDVGSSRNSSCNSAAAALALGRQKEQQHGQQQHGQQQEGKQQQHGGSSRSSSKGRDSSVTTALLSFRHRLPRGLLELFMQITAKLANHRLIRR